MFNNKNFFFPNRNQKVFILLLCFPIFLMLGNFFINFFYISIFVLSILNFKKNNFFYKSNIFYLLLIFFFYLVINLYFSINFENSIPRVIKFIFIIFFILEIQKLMIEDKNLINKIFYLWVIIFFIVSFDIFFEYLFDFNTLGHKSIMKGRISSFFGDELVVGNFYHFLSLIVISYFLTKKYSNLSIIGLAGIIIAISFIIGERANFIKLFLSILIFLNFTIKINFFKKIVSLMLILSAVFFILISNLDLKFRYYDQIKTLYTIDGIVNYYKQSQYGAHQNAAFKIFRNNVYFGVGVKNFRHESQKKIYENKDFKATDSRWATHPHQLHMELLSETGLFGYIIFLGLMIYAIYISLKNYFVFRNNYYQIATILYLLTSLIPFIPTGSIFSTFFGGIFWFNFGLMLSLNYYSKS